MFASVMQKTADLIGELIGFPLGKKKRIYGIGMAVSGPSNRTRGIVEFSPSFHWHKADMWPSRSSTRPSSTWESELPI